MPHFGPLGLWVASVIAVVFFAGTAAAATYVHTTSNVVGKTVGILVSIPGPLITGFNEARKIAVGTNGGPAPQVQPHHPNKTKG